MDGSRGDESLVLSWKARTGKRIPTGLGGWQRPWAGESKPSRAGGAPRSFRHARGNVHRAPSWAHTVNPRTEVGASCWVEHECREVQAKK